ncbi:helix-turn-helix transcriptional regulator [Hyphomicrobium sp. LHD-15]|uniref:AraC family transcriptional regulator n=1 Tax=Hyphomicrobium sp. LHD-15 TaxID=3072142 RepID=UPI0028106E0F|nr:helix-turn-helix transcriptional regulator [Hyphomicrobium sp. LHD-15]MDQ8700553.1 helix-turn-helix transcriptional regulator [Hyphomicrobium sp. LHD-15]
METDTSQPAPSLSFSAVGVPDRKRLSALRDYLSDMMRTEVEALNPDAPFEYAASLRIVPGASWGSAVSSAVATTRTASLVKDGCDDLMLVMPQSRMTVVAPGKDDLVIQPGDAVLLSKAREMQVILHERGTCWASSVSHRDIARLVPQIGSAPILAIRNDVPMLPLLARYGNLLENDPLIGSAVQGMAARHLQEMMALAIGGSADFQEEAAQTTLASVRLKALEADVFANLGDTNLSLEWIAARQNVSPRHLQRLLARKGTSFSDLVRRARVSRARAMLESPHNAGRSILSIALECGFPEASALNRAFRQEYGLTPGEVRWRR